MPLIAVTVATPPTPSCKEGTCCRWCPNCSCGERLPPGCRSLTTPPMNSGPVRNGPPFAAHRAGSTSTPPAFPRAGSLFSGDDHEFPSDRLAREADAFLHQGVADQWWETCVGAGVGLHFQTPTGVTDVLPKVTGVQGPDRFTVEVPPGMIVDDLRKSSGGSPPAWTCRCCGSSRTARPLRGACRAARRRPARPGDRPCGDTRPSVWIARTEDGTDIACRPDDLPHMITQGSTRSGKSAWTYGAARAARAPTGRPGRRCRRVRAAAAPVHRHPPRCVAGGRAARPRPALRTCLAAARRRDGPPDRRTAARGGPAHHDPGGSADPLRARGVAGCAARAGHRHRQDPREALPSPRRPPARREPQGRVPGA